MTEPGKNFVLSVYSDFDSTQNQFIGYVTYELIDEVRGSEYVLRIGSQNKDDALRFQYLKEDAVYVDAGVATGTYVCKALLPGAKNSLELEPQTGDYLLYRGQGGEFNPLLFGTLEYRARCNWSLYDLNGRSISTPIIPSYGLTIGSGSVTLCTGRVGSVTKSIYFGAHLRTIKAGQLIFDSTYIVDSTPHVGITQPIYFKFEPI